MTDTVKLESKINVKTTGATAKPRPVKKEG